MSELSASNGDSEEPFFFLFLGQSRAKLRSPPTVGVECADNLTIGSTENTLEQPDVRPPLLCLVPCCQSSVALTRVPFSRTQWVNGRRNTERRL